MCEALIDRYFRQPEDVSRLIFINYGHFLPDQILAPSYLN